jgi:hypothetical protein
VVWKSRAAVRASSTGMVVQWYASVRLAAPAMAGTNPRRLDPMFPRVLRVGSDATNRAALDGPNGTRFRHQYG